jgi:hypothetical protein
MIEMEFWSKITKGLILEIAKMEFWTKILKGLTPVHPMVQGEV